MREEDQTVERGTLLETGKYQVLRQMLEKTFGTLYEEEYGITGDTTIAEYVGFINSQPISGVEKEILLQPVT